MYTFSNNTLVRCGLEQLQHATTLDTGGTASSAVVVRAYKSALDNLVPGRLTVTDPQARQWLEEKIGLALSRAEALKANRDSVRQQHGSRQQLPRVVPSPSPPSLAPARPIRLEDAVQLVRQANAADAAGDWQAAHDAYIAALDILLPLQLPSWKSRVERYIARVEELQMLLGQRVITKTETTTSMSTLTPASHLREHSIVSEVHEVAQQLSHCRDRIGSMIASGTYVWICPSGGCRMLKQTTTRSLILCDPPQRAAARCRCSSVVLCTLQHKKHKQNWTSSRGTSNTWAIKAAVSNHVWPRQIKMSWRYLGGVLLRLSGQKGTDSVKASGTKLGPQG